MRRCGGRDKESRRRDGGRAGGSLPFYREQGGARGEERSGMRDAESADAGGIRFFTSFLYGLVA